MCVYLCLFFVSSCFSFLCVFVYVCIGLCSLYVWLYLSVLCVCMCIVVFEFAFLLCLRVCVWLAFVYLMIYIYGSVYMYMFIPPFFGLYPTLYGFVCKCMFLCGFFLCQCVYVWECLCVCLGLFVSLCFKMYM